MIGKVALGTSFYGCLSYCLEDKRELSEEQKQQLSLQEGLQHKDRAEVLAYNLCFGDKHALAEQFRDVKKLSKRVEKPVMHLTIRAAPGDSLTREQWREIGQAAAQEFGLADHQYICVLHKDTRQPHIHLVGNRVGYDGKVASDSNSYARMATLCRRMEKQYNLQQVLSPRRFLSPKERQIPRQDTRKEQLRTDIQDALRQTYTYPDFEKTMQEKGYRIDKGRGIAFEDNKKVRTKGSEVGYSLSNIERILAQNASKKGKLSPMEQLETTAQRAIVRQKINHSVHDHAARVQRKTSDHTKGHDAVHNLTHLVNQLLKPETDTDGVSDQWAAEEEKRRKKKKRKYRHP
ncbi:MAG TPA: relaxase/mobilization nuclease domain-containing protein [Puia sp.]|nr:relaxase/mobilization nuclease domain-containing protein [Puia sp.]